MHEAPITNPAPYGWGALACSSILMAISAMEPPPLMEDMWWLFLARCFGVTGFLLGVACLVQQRWNNATPLIICSLVLPILSLVIHSRI